MSKLLFDCADMEDETGDVGLIWTAMERGVCWPAFQVATTAPLTRREANRIMRGRQPTDTALQLQSTITGERFALMVPAGARASRVVRQAVDIALAGRPNPAVLPANHA